MPNPNLPINARMNTYIGARYVPKFANPTEWASTVAYEPLTIVTYQGNSYTSKTFVPVGVDINNATYWAVTGNYNAQVESYRQETLQLQNTVEAQKPIISGTENTWNIGSTSWVESSTPTTLPTLLPAQGSIIVNGQLYIYETNDSDTGYVTQINLSNMAVVNRDERYCGHGNGITVLNNNLFIIGTGQIFVYSITNNSLVYVGVYDCPYGQAIACGATANYIVFVGGGRISFCTFDSTNGLSIFASYPSYSLVTEYAPAYQGGYVYNGMFFIMSGTSKYVLLSGVQLSTMNNLFLVMCERPAVVNEPQSFTITQDVIYFVGTDGTNNYLWTAPTPRTLGLHYNSFNNREQPVLTERGATSKIIYVNLSTGNDVKGDGQNGNPFRTIQRAIREMNLYYLEGISRSIAVTGSSSDMVVIESQHNLQLSLNCTISQLFISHCSEIEISGTVNVTNSGTGVNVNMSSVAFSGKINGTGNNRVLNTTASRVSVSALEGTAGIGIYENPGSVVICDGIAGTGLTNAAYVNNSILCYTNNTSGKGVQSANGSIVSSAG